MVRVREIQFGWSEVSVGHAHFGTMNSSSVPAE
jgi:hypothetical protein